MMESGNQLFGANKLPEAVAQYSAVSARPTQRLSAAASWRYERGLRITTANSTRAPAYPLGSMRLMS